MSYQDQQNEATEEQLKPYYDKVYLQADSINFTDDSSVAESAGQVIHLIEGSYKNIKITTPEDLLLAEAVLKQFKY